VRARKRAGRWQVWLPSAAVAADLGIRMVPDAPEHPDALPPDNPDCPDDKGTAVPDDPEHQETQGQTESQEPPQGPQTALLAQRAQEMAAYTERLLAPLYGRLEAQATQIGRLEERAEHLQAERDAARAELEQARARIVELEAPVAPEPESVPPPEPESRRWWQRLLWG
jgi:hypothetical protein